MLCYMSLDANFTCRGDKYYMQILQIIETRSNNILLFSIDGQEITKQCCYMSKNPHELGELDVWAAIA